MNTNTHEKKISRRLFLRLIGWGSLFTAIGISVIGTFRFMFPRVLFEAPPVFTVGFPEEFKSTDKADINGVCKVYENWKQDQSVWIVREQDRIYAIHSKCTHLGCTPRWFEEDGVFKCPCHGSQFDSNGVNFAGPAPRPLDRFRIFIDDSGRICVDKSKTYVFSESDKPDAYINI
jgi:cytochrome b6-f complex iron-sulfur subunit